MGAQATFLKKREGIQFEKGEHDPPSLTLAPPLDILGLIVNFVDLNRHISPTILWTKKRTTSSILTLIHKTKLPTDELYC